MKTKPNKSRKGPKSAPKAAEVDETQDGGVAVAEADGDIPFPEDQAPADEPEAESEPEPAPKKPKKGKAEPEAAPAASDEIQSEYAEGYEVLDIPVDGLKLNTLRTPTDDDVDTLARSIRAVGLQDPIVITQDGLVADGNTRLMAFRKLKRATIPARIALDPKTGDPLTSKDIMSRFIGLAANLGRTDMTAEQIAKAAAALVEDGAVESMKDLSARTGINQSALTRATRIYESGSTKLLAAIRQGVIGTEAAYHLITNCRDQAHMDKALEAVIAAAGPKGGTQAAAKAVVPSKRSGRHAKKGKAGRKPSIAVLSSEALATPETGATATLRKTAPDTFLISIAFAIDCGQVQTFAKFDLAKKVQAAMAKVDAKSLRSELELCRQQLTD